jgi:hypothetical protein
MTSGNHCTAVVIITKKYRINGNIDLIQGSRLTDYVAATKSFFAVTDAVVEHVKTGEVILRAGFIDINKDKINIIFPTDSLVEE